MKLKKGDWIITKSEQEPNYEWLEEILEINQKKIITKHLLTKQKNEIIQGTQKKLEYTTYHTKLCLHLHNTQTILYYEYRKPTPKEKSQYIAHLI